MLILEWEKCILHLQCSCKPNTFLFQVEVGKNCFYIISISHFSESWVPESYQVSNNVSIKANVKSQKFVLVTRNNNPPNFIKSS